jgi:hypothetical protein
VSELDNLPKGAAELLQSVITGMISVRPLRFGPYLIRGVITSRRSIFNVLRTSDGVIVASCSEELAADAAHRLLSSRP